MKVNIAGKTEAQQFNIYSNTKENCCGFDFKDETAIGEDLCGTRIYK